MLCGYIDHKKKYGKIILEEKEYSIIECPHCLGQIIIYNKDLNCKQFIHAVNKITGKPLNPHKKATEDYIGCGDRFRIKKN
jgi:DNA-directed RNA polymerase subunit RPC12/RpoP